LSVFEFFFVLAGHLFVVKRWMAANCHFGLNDNDTSRCFGAEFCLAIIVFNVNCLALVKGF
jgi:hypothetical protein